MAASGCYVQQPPVTPAVAESSTFLIAMGGYVGTGWVVGPHELITAGHLCEPDNVMTVNGIAKSNAERRIPVTIVAWELTPLSPPPDHTPADLCLLHADADLPPPLTLNRAMPDVGATVGFVGYPGGIRAERTGKFLGDIDGPNEHYDDADSSTPTDHGASGAAMFTDAGVFGVLVRVRADGSSIHDGSDGAAATPLPQLITFLDDYHVNYTLTDFYTAE